MNFKHLLTHRLVVIKFNRKLILASTSPRRQFLLQELGFHFRIENPESDESFPNVMPAEAIPKFLAEQKAETLKSTIKDEIVMTADTVVIIDGGILNKPDDRHHAIEMLNCLSGRTHTVITAVCLLDREKQDVFDDHSRVTFKKLSQKEIEFYVDTCKPLDKAGAYGAQECLPSGVNPCSHEEIKFLKEINKMDLIEKSINTKAGSGMACIEKITGSYFNVMGLPIHKVYEHLLSF